MKKIFFSNLGIRKELPYSVKEYLPKPTATIKLKGKTLKALCVRL